MRALFSILIVIIFLNSCQDIPAVQKPDRFIDETMMEHILYESVLISSARGYNTAQLKIVGIQPETYIYEKYNIDSLTYAQNLAYYTADVDVYKVINSRVLERVRNELKFNDSLETKEQKERDSLRKINVRSLVNKDTLLEKRLPLRTITDTFSRKPKPRRY